MFPVEVDHDRKIYIEMQTKINKQTFNKQVVTKTELGKLIERANTKLGNSLETLSPIVTTKILSGV